VFFDDVDRDRARAAVAGIALAVAVIAGLAGCAPQGAVDGTARQPGDGRHFRKGMLDVSIAGSVDYHNTSNSQVDRAHNFEFKPRCGYFVTDRLELLAAAGIEYQSVEYDRKGDLLELDRVKNQNYSAALGFQYNLDSDYPVVPFVAVYGGLVKSRKEMVQTNIPPMMSTAEVKDETTAPYVGGTLGARYFVLKTLSVDLGLGYKRIMFDDDFGGDTDDFSLVVGASLLF
jgi:hypothetical protein